MEIFSAVLGILLAYLGVIILLIKPKDRDMTRYTDSIEAKFKKRFMK